MSKSFSISSCWQTFQWMMFSNRRSLTSCFIGAAVAVFIGELLLLLMFGDISIGDMTYTRNYSGDSMWNFIVLSLGVWMLVGASRMFRFMKQRQSAVAYLMLPASNAEKFVALAFYSSVLWGVVGGVGMLAGDFLRWAANPIFGCHAQTAVTGIYHSATSLARLCSSMPADIADFVEVLACIVSFCLWTYSFYMLGSALLRRHPLLLTSLALIAINILGIGLSHRYVPDLSLAIMAGAFWVLIVANVAAAYWLFCRMQVINRKWFNF